MESKKEERKSGQSPSPAVRVKTGEEAAGSRYSSPFGCYMDSEIDYSIEDDECVYSRIFDCGFNVIAAILSGD